MTNFNRFVKNQIKNKKSKSEKLHFYWSMLKSLFRLLGYLSLFFSVYSSLNDLFYLGVIILAIAELAGIVEEF